MGVPGHMWRWQARWDGQGRLLGGSTIAAVGGHRARAALPVSWAARSRRPTNEAAAGRRAELWRTQHAARRHRAGEPERRRTSRGPFRWPADRIFATRQTGSHSRPWRSALVSRCRLIDSSTLHSCPAEDLQGARGPVNRPGLPREAHRAAPQPPIVHPPLPAQEPLHPPGCRSAPLAPRLRPPAPASDRCRMRPRLQP